jgi:hypothetical protein
MTPPHGVDLVEFYDANTGEINSDSLAPLRVCLWTARGKRGYSVQAGAVF